MAADAGTVVQMNSASATTITVNQSLFAAGDSVQIQNVGSGVCTVIAGSATVSTAGSLALSQYEGGQLYFNTTSAALFFDLVQSAAAGGKVLQVVSATYETQTSNSTSTAADTGLTATITPTLNTSNILVIVSQNGVSKAAGNTESAINLRLLRGASVISYAYGINYTGVSAVFNGSSVTINYLDAPATTSATTYKTTFANDANAASVSVQRSGSMSIITLLEIGA